LLSINDLVSIKNNWIREDSISDHRSLALRFAVCSWPIVRQRAQRLNADEHDYALDRRRRIGNKPWRLFVFRYKNVKTPNSRWIKQMASQDCECG
jgi:hypothetical protein